MGEIYEAIRASSKPMAHTLQVTAVERTQRKGTKIPLSRQSQEMKEELAVSAEEKKEGTAVQIEEKKAETDEYSAAMQQAMGTSELLDMSTAS